MILKKGVKSNEVAIVQNALNLGTTFVTELTIDGDFGAKTEARVKQFQQQKDLKPDGIVGPRTLNALFTGVQLTGTITVRPGTQNVGQVADTDRQSVNPYGIYPRDVQWHMEMKAWLDWVAKPFPKRAAPPLPNTLPPSLSLPPTGLTVPPLHTFPVPITPGKVELHPVPLFTGGNFELSTSDGFKSSTGKKSKEHKFKFTLDFSKVTGLVHTNQVQHDVVVAHNTKGQLEVEQTITITPFKLFDASGKAVHTKVVPLLLTSLNSSFDVALFAGVKGITSFHPFGQGFTILVGGKLGPKVKINHNEDGQATASVYPLAGEGTVEFQFQF